MFPTCPCAKSLPCSLVSPIQVLEIAVRSSQSFLFQDEKPQIYQPVLTGKVFQASDQLSASSGLIPTGLYFPSSRVWKTVLQ